MANQQDDVFIHYQDPDEQETSEWIEALHSVIENEGPERAHYLMERMADVQAKGHQSSLFQQYGLYQYYSPRS